MTIKAIETVYNGYRFRSRLEARWAVVFTHLGIKWTYEPEGFHLPSGRMYLPDFFLEFKRDSLWVEIKPEGQSTDKFEEFIEAEGQQHRGTVLTAIPNPAELQKYGRDNSLGDGFHMWGGGPEGGWDNCYQFCICDECGEIGFEFDGRSARIGCKCETHKGSDKNYTGDHSVLISAFSAALSARFEHGESPAPAPFYRRRFKKTTSASISTDSG